MNAKKEINESEPSKKEVPSDSPMTCGIIMPIAAMGEHYPESHWADVKVIISDAIKLAGFSPRLVSESDDARVIQSSIVQNVYNDPIIVCDVSAKNANVMFELGMRLAFDKPVVIVVDQATGFSFDTAPIEHLLYRRDLRHSTVEEFKTKLAAKIKSTYEKSKDKANGSFLSNFGQFKVAKIEDKEINSSEVVEKLFMEVQGIQSTLRNLSLDQKYTQVATKRAVETNKNTSWQETFMLDGYTNSESAINDLKSYFGSMISEINSEGQILFATFTGNEGLKNRISAKAADIVRRSSNLEKDLPF